jgi:type I restriction enzyme S subunit
VKQAVCSDSYTTKHIVRDTLRPDKTADNLPYEKIGNNEPVCIADEVPFDIPDSWEWVRISGVFSVINGDRGKNYPAKSTLSNTGIPFISAVNLDGKTVIEDDNLLCLSDEQFNKLGSGKLEKDDVVVCIRGSLGKHGRYPFEKGAIASSLVILRPHLNIPLLSDFIMMYLDSPLFFSEIKRYDNGTAQPNLAAKSLEMFFLPLPPLSEQKRIVEKLNEVSSLTDNYAEAYVRVAELNQKFPELLKKSVLQEAVQGKLVPQDPNDEPASVLLGRIRAEKQALVKAGKIKKDKNESVIFRRDNSHYEKRGSEEVCIDDEILFEVPSSWALIRLNDIGIYRKGPFGSSLTKSMFVPKGDDTVKVYEQKNAIQKDHTLGTYYITRQYYESKMKSFTVEPGDILVSCAGTIGETYVLPEQIELGIINQALMRMTIYAPIDLNYFLMYFDYVLKQTAKDSSKGSAIKNIPPFEIFKKLILPLPPIEEQKRIVLKVRELENLCNLLY